MNIEMCAAMYVGYNYLGLEHGREVKIKFHSSYVQWLLIWSSVFLPLGCYTEATSRHALSGSYFVDNAITIKLYAAKM